MNKIISFLLVLLFAMGSQLSQAQTQYTLDDVIALAKGQSTSAKVAETRKKNRYWQYRFYKSNYNPQLRLEGDLPNYNKDYFENRLDDGTIQFQSRQQINSFVNLGIDQPLQWTGGNLSLNTNLSHFKDFEFDNIQYKSTLFNVRLVQPIFGFNDLKWDKKTEPLRYLESQRSYVEEMESIAQQAVNKFFTYLDAQINFQIAKFNLANNDTIYKIEQGRYNIGTTSKDRLLQMELQLLRSQQDVTQAQLDLQTAGLDLRSFLGLTDEENFELILPKEIPEFDINVGEALKYARENRADYIAFERRRLEAERDVAEAKSQRFSTNLVASYGLNNRGDEISSLGTDPLPEQRLNVTFSIPIIDWGRNKARMQTAIANQELEDYIIAQNEQTFEQEIITQVNQFSVLISQIKITQKSDEVANERYNVTQNRYLVGKIDITNLNIALTEKDDAKRSYLNALRVFWSNYYGLRRLTLYDFENDKLLFKTDD